MVVFRFLITLLLFVPHLIYAQTAVIKIEIKPNDLKKAYNLIITKTPDEIKIVHQKVDSIGKIDFSEKDLAIVKKLINKSSQFFDSLSNDSLAFFQNKIDSIKKANTFYKSDSMSIYNNTHRDYTKFVEMFLLTPKDILELRKADVGVENNCFFTIKKNGSKSEFFVEGIDIKAYPLPSKLILDSLTIIDAYRKVMQRKNQY